MAGMSVVLVEDDRGTREALAHMLRMDGVEVVGSFATGEAAVAGAPALRPDVALVDLALPGICGVETIRRLKALLPELGVLVLSVFEDQPCRSQCVLGHGAMLAHAIAAGARGFLLKDAAFANVRHALEQVHQGLAPISPEIARHLLTLISPTAAAEQPGPASPGAPLAASPGTGAAERVLDLTAREKDVLALIAMGHSYGNIASALSLQLGTVQTHVRNIYRKLDVSSKAEAACIATAHGLVCLTK